MDDIDNAILLRETIETCIKHAKQGQLEPERAKDQCWEIEQLLAPLIPAPRKEQPK